MSDFAISPQMVHTQGNNPHESKGFSFRDLLNPVSLIGRICEDWKPIATIVLVVVGVVTSIFSWSLFNLFLFVSLGGIASILIRDIRDLGTYKDLNKDHADINDDQVLITLNLAAEVDGLDLVRQRLEAQNAQLDEAVTGHVATNARQGRLVDQQAEQIRVSTEARAEEREQFAATLREQKEQTRLLEDRSRELEAESARVKLEVDALLKVMSEKSGTLSESVTAVVKAQAAFAEATDASHEQGTANNTIMAGHLDTFRETLLQATGDHAQLAKVRDEFMRLMTVEEDKLRPLREFMEHVAQNPTVKANLQAAKEAQRQVEASTRRHAELETQVAALTKQLEGLEPAIADAERRFETASERVLGVTETLVTARDQAVRATGQLTAAQQAAALLRQQQFSGAGHQGAGGKTPLGGDAQGEVIA